MEAKFITFEGTEGSGKSTHIRLLCKFLKEKSISFLYIREPGGTKLGEKIRKIVLDKNNKMNSFVEMLLYMASRAILVKEVILPAFKEGKIVICDRFLDATLAYQGYAGGVDINLINTIGEYVTSGITPGFTIYLDIDTKTGLKRLKNKDRIERKPLVYHNKVMEGYKRLIKQYPQRFRVVLTNNSVKETQKIIRKMVLDYIC